MSCKNHEQKGTLRVLIYMLIFDGIEVSCYPLHKHTCSEKGNLDKFNYIFVIKQIGILIK